MSIRRTNPPIKRERKVLNKRIYIAGEQMKCTAPLLYYPKLLNEVNECYLSIDKKLMDRYYKMF